MELVNFSTDTLPLISDPLVIIVWQRFCEQARLRIAKCHGLNCLTAHGFNVNVLVNQSTGYYYWSLAYPFARQAVR